MRAQQDSASRITDRGFSDIHVQKTLLVGCAPSHFTGSGMSRHHADRHPPSPLDRRESNVDDGRGSYLGNVPVGEPTTASSSTACSPCTVEGTMIIIVTDCRPAVRFRQT